MEWLRIFINARRFWYTIEFYVEYNKQIKNILIRWKAITFFQNEYTFFGVILYRIYQTLITNSLFTPRVHTLLSTSFFCPETLFTVFLLSSYFGSRGLLFSFCKLGVPVQWTRIFYIWYRSFPLLIFVFIFRGCLYWHIRDCMRMVALKAGSPVELFWTQCLQYSFVTFITDGCTN